MYFHQNQVTLQGEQHFLKVRTLFTCFL